MCVCAPASESFHLFVVAVCACREPNCGQVHTGRANFKSHPSRPTQTIYHVRLDMGHGFVRMSSVAKPHTYTIFNLHIYVPCYCCRCRCCRLLSSRKRRQHTKKKNPGQSRWTRSAVGFGRMRVSLTHTHAMATVRERATVVSSQLQ